MELFPRKIIAQLDQWSSSSDRKPLIIRGARQVGKTTAIHIFSEKFDQYIHLNLEKSEEANLFRRVLNVHELFQSICLFKNISPKKGRLLLFIDEIQNSPEAVSILRYFYEEMPDLHVIAAGSLFEIMLERKQISFPVGRVQYLFMYPLNFEEHLVAMNENQALEVLDQVPCPDFAHQRLLKLFHTYTLVGGMPEIVEKYRKSKNVTEVNPVFESLLTAYTDDVSKYAKNDSMRNIIKHCIESAPNEAGKRITFAGFGSSNYKSREIGEALKTLERAMLLYLFYPTTSTHIPLMQNLKKSPRLQFLDTGILNYRNGLQQHFFEYNDLHSFYRGVLAEHIVAQELIAHDLASIQKPIFWVREKKQSNAELDFVINFDTYAIPVEVKAGKAGKLRSLHQFINRCNHPYAVRLYSGPLEIQETKTPEGKNYYLLNLPLFLAGRLNKYIAWFLDH